MPLLHIEALFPLIIVFGNADELGIGEGDFGGFIGGE